MINFFFKASSNLGCFKDNDSRDLPYRAYYDSQNTVSRCISECLKLNYQYAGVENG